MLQVGILWDLFATFAVGPGGLIPVALMTQKPTDDPCDTGD